MRNHPMYRLSHERQVGIAYLHDNRLNSRIILLRVRWMMDALSLVFAAGITLWAFWMLGPPGAFLATLFWCLNPLVIGNSHIVKPDLAMAGFFLWSLFAFWRWCRTGAWSWAALARAGIGFGHASKYFFVLLMPVFALMALIENRPSDRKSPERWISGYIWADLGAYLVLALLYRGDWSLEIWRDGLEAGRTLMPASSVQGTAWLDRSWLYFLALLIIKTPIPLLGLSGWGSYRILKSPLSRDLWWWLAPAIGFLAMTLGFNTYASGHRHLLPVYPYAALLAALDGCS